MLDRYNRARLKRRDGERRSKLEDQVAENLETHGYSATYEQDKFKYVISRTYRPDFKVGDFYIEVKGGGSRLTSSWPWFSATLTCPSLLRCSDPCSASPKRLALLTPSGALVGESAGVPSRYHPTSFIHGQLDKEPHSMSRPRGCGSTDAASVCADGSIYCFACRRRFNTTPQ